MAAGQPQRQSHKGNTMERLKLVRFASLKTGTLGRLTYKNKSWWSVERPWLNNLINISCIPEGIYTMRRFYDVHQYRSSKSIDGAYVWEICDVNGRTVILIHVANWPTEVKGCIALGMGMFKNMSGVSKSKNAIKEFYRLTSNETEMEIEIVNGCVEDIAA